MLETSIHQNWKNTNTLKDLKPLPTFIGINWIRLKFVNEESSPFNANRKRIRPTNYYKPNKIRNDTPTGERNRNTIWQFFGSW